MFFPENAGFQGADKPSWPALAIGPKLQNGLLALCLQEGVWQGTLCKLAENFSPVATTGKSIWTNASRDTCVHHISR
jgi:hypothetical protein